MQLILEFRGGAKMFITVVITVVILGRIAVAALYLDDELNTDNLENISITSYIFKEDNSVRVNLTWDNDLGNLPTLYMLIENHNGSCSYMDENIFYYPDINSIISPSLDILNPAESISLACTYSINVTLEEHTFFYLYRVPDCIGNFCVCSTNETNLIDIVGVEASHDDVYQIRYTSRNKSLIDGNYHIVEIFYFDKDEDNKFEVPKVSYKKGWFEIHMEYLTEGTNYTLGVVYKDADNANPECYYTTNFNFKAQFPKVYYTDYLSIKIVISVSIFVFASALLLCLLKQSKYYFFITLEELKSCFFPNENLTTVEDLTVSVFSCPRQEINKLYTPFEIMNLYKYDDYEFPRDNVIIKDVIGEGAFGKVYYAKAYNINGLPGYSMVAVKQLRVTYAPKEAVADFQAEIKMLKKIGVHKNIVKLLGCVTKSQPNMMIMELISNGRFERISFQN
ncbi:hypothetical protein NQ317_001248 [Molorchus minor]|uniref:Protein kinase domain-containing protein n=1 Tax=Molorchus minor TaxID=1323400 RepID=A0ABQ9J2L1_9CUCU|nr:hypothetical protein NQ317_001248 [Molorchus minor]